MIGPVNQVELLPDDGYYPLPYMAVQADGSAWEEECAQPFAAEARARQPFLPDGSRSFEEIDRLGIGSHGLGNLIGARADVDFYRIEPRQIVSDNLKSGITRACFYEPLVNRTMPTWRRNHRAALPRGCRRHSAPTWVILGWSLGELIGYLKGNPVKQTNNLNTNFSKKFVSDQQ